MLIMHSKALMQPAMVMTADRRPKRALWLITNNILGPGVADTTKVITTKSHHACKLMNHSLIF
jgi:hypothetical protein